MKYVPCPLAEDRTKSYGCCCLGKTIGIGSMFLQVFLSMVVVGVMILQQLLTKQMIESIYLILDLYDALQYQPRIAAELYCGHKPATNSRFCRIDFDLIHQGGWDSVCEHLQSGRVALMRYYRIGMKCRKILPFQRAPWSYRWVLLR